MVLYHVRQLRYILSKQWVVVWQKRTAMFDSLFRFESEAEQPQRKNEQKKEVDDEMMMCQ
jgi:hypothetical protein